MAILAAGVGFALRGGIFGAWKSEYNFTDMQLGAIGGAGFTGFCFGIIIGGVIVDKLGYGKLVALALLGHVVSAFVTFGASTPDNAYNFLYAGMFIFAYANGTLEAVANPLVATVFPKQRMHYLNILHASWPLGMVVGALASYLLGTVMGLGWKGQLAFYLVPTAAYAVMFLGQSFPKSEAAEKGASLGEMFKDVGILGAVVASYLLALFLGDVLGKFGIPNAGTVGWGISGALVVLVGIITRFSFGSILLFVLFLTHALVGAVELGTDGWIESITGNLFTAGQGKTLFIWTSAIMFGLRFCADLRTARRRGSDSCKRHADLCHRPGGARHLRPRKDLLLADDARGGGRPLPTLRRCSDVDHGWNRDALSRSVGRPRVGLLQGPLRRRIAQGKERCALRPVQIGEEFSVSDPFRSDPYRWQEG
jgi:MFS family permease